MKKVDFTIAKLQGLQQDIVSLVKFLRQTEETKRKCDLCGKDGLSLSQITLEGGYGSKYDCERASLDVCEDCFDRLYEQWGCADKSKPYIPIE